MPLDQCLRRAVRFGAAAIVLLLAACAGTPGDAPFADDSPPPQLPTAYIYLEAVQAAFIGSGEAGSGFVDYQGKHYALKVGGLGVGGIGASKIVAHGDVYNLYRVEDVAGVYGEARVGWAAGRSGDGQMWLENDQGVVIHLDTKREGLMLSLGVSGLDLRFATTAPVATAPPSPQTPAEAVPGDYAVGMTYSALPAGCMEVTKNGRRYDLCGNTWFASKWTPDGDVYTVVTAP